MKVFGIFFFILNFLDGLLTFSLVFQAGSYSVEFNPIMRWLMILIGDWFMLPKVLMGFVVALVALLYWRKYKWFRVSFIFLTALYFLTVVNHIMNHLILMGV